MSTWKIFSGAGNNFRWEITGRDIETRPEGEQRDIGAPSFVQRHNSSSRLPSMADLLLQGKFSDSKLFSAFFVSSGSGDNLLGLGCSKLLEDNDEGFDRTPMFKTGSGRTVPVKQSSIAKALSVLGQDDSFDTGHY